VKSETPTLWDFRDKYARTVEVNRKLNANPVLKRLAATSDLADLGLTGMGETIARVTAANEERLRRRLEALALDLRLREDDPGPLQPD
jgi:hypothetical protein